MIAMAVTAGILPAGIGTPSFDPTAAPAAVPTNLTLPAIRGSAEVGQELTVSSGSWEGSAPIHYTYAWQTCDASGENCEDISGANANAYVPLVSEMTETDILRAVVTAENAAGSTGATSEATAVLTPGPPWSIEAPTIKGTAREGETLTASKGSWAGTGSAEYDYQWQRCTNASCSPIDHATGLSYRATSSDVGSTLKFIVTAKTAVGEASAPAATPEVEARGGAVADWGENYLGQLGTVYKDIYELSPVAVEGLSTVTEIAAASSFNLALLSDGTVASWGAGRHGQLGDDKDKANWEGGDSHVAVEEENPVTHEVVGALHGVKAIAAANEHALVLMDDGTVMAWGNNQYGQLGDGEQGFEKITNINERLPKTVPGLTNVKAVAAGGGSDFALTSENTVMAWGSDTEGQLGLGEPGPDHCETETALYPRFELCSERPLPVMWKSPQTGEEEELKEVKAIYAGQFAAYALLKDGRVVSWGANHLGQLGTGAETVHGSELPAAEVKRPNGEPLNGVVEVAAGYNLALARLQDGEVVGWGSAEQGALAGASAENCKHAISKKREQELKEKGEKKPEPLMCVKMATPVTSLETLKVEAIAAGRNYGLALSGGKVYAWGNNEHGQLGRGKMPKNQRNPETGRNEKEPGYPVPARVKALGAVEAISAANSQAVVLLKSEVEPPRPLITVVPEELALRLSWGDETVDGREKLTGERLLYRAFERGAEIEPAEEGKAASEEGPPVNVASEPPTITLAGEPVEAQTLVTGEKVDAEPGGWSGARPMTFEYQWQRCNAQGESCSNIESATRPHYTLAAGDVGSTVRVLVTANGAEATRGTASSQPTEVVEVAEEGEKRKDPATSIRLNGTEESFMINKTIEKLPSREGERRPVEVSRPLEAIPYEVRLRASGKSRVMVLTPLATVSQ